MKDSARYAKIVEWPEEDHCYVGSAPGLIYGGTHGNDEKAVFEDLCRIVEEAIELYRKEGKPLPPATSGRDFVNKMQQVASPSGGENVACREVLQPRALVGATFQLQCLFMISEGMLPRSCLNMIRRPSRCQLSIMG